MTTEDELARRAALYKSAYSDALKQRLYLAEYAKKAINEGMSESEAARIAGVSRTTIRHWMGKS